MSEDLTGRVALVTGAARGLGLATAERLAARGAAVAVNVRDPERAEAAARSLGERGFAVPGDLGDPADLEAVVDRTLDRFGRLDILVNNAAVAASPPASSRSPRRSGGAPSRSTSPPSSCSSAPCCRR